MEFTGLGGSLTLTSGTTVTGANGDVKFADATDETYANITALGPYVDVNGNLIDKA